MHPRDTVLPRVEASIRGALAAVNVSSSSSSVMNDEQSQEVEALAAIMGEDMWTDAEQPGSHCFFISPQVDSETEVCCSQSRWR